MKITLIFLAAIFVLTVIAGDAKSAAQVELSGSCKLEFPMIGGIKAADGSVWIVAGRVVERYEIKQGRPVSSPLRNWRSQFLEGSISRPPTLVSSSGRQYLTCTTDKGVIYAVDTTNGAFLKGFSSERESFSFAPVALNDGSFVCVGDAGGYYQCSFANGAMGLRLNVQYDSARSSNGIVTSQPVLLKQFKVTDFLVYGTDHFDSVRGRDEYDLTCISVTNSSSASAAVQLISLPAPILVEPLRLSRDKLLLTLSNGVICEALAGGTVHQVADIEPLFMYSLDNRDPYKNKQDRTRPDAIFARNPIRFKNGFFVCCATFNLRPGKTDTDVLKSVKDGILFVFDANCQMTDHIANSFAVTNPTTVFVNGRESLVVCNDGVSGFTAPTLSLYDSASLAAEVVGETRRSRYEVKSAIPRKIICPPIDLGGGLVLLADDQPSIYTIQISETLQPSSR